MNIKKEIWCSRIMEASNPAVCSMDKFVTKEKNRISCI